MWRAYRDLKRRVDAAVNEDLLADSGLSEPDYDVLSNLSEAQDTQLRVTDLGERLRWSKSRTSHHLSRMHKRGLIEKRTDSDDGRVTLARLTSDGLRTIQDAAPLHVRSVRRHFLDLLTEEDHANLTTLANRVRLSHDQRRTKGV